MSRKTGLLLLIFTLLLTSASAAGSPVDMNVTNGEVRDVLTALAAVGGVSIVADDTVSGKITVRLNGVPFATALDIITKTKGLNYQRLGDIIIVGSPEQLQRGFGEIAIFRLQYAEAAEAAGLLGVVLARQPGSAGAALSNRLKVDAATNSLVFSGTPGETDQIRQVLAAIDIPCQQVVLEAQVLAINRDAAKSLGVEWEWSKGPNYPDYSKADDGSWTVERKTTADHDNIPGIIQFGRTPEGFSYEMYYQFKINALVTEGKASVLAKPKIMTINGREAVINIGGELPVSVTTISDHTTTTSIEYKDAGIILKYTPRVNADGYITATVHTEVSSPAYVPELKAYKFNKRSANTEVRLKDGETMVIGGLIGKDELSSVRKVPLLGDLPVLGALFRSVGNSQNESEVVIFLTAHIVK